MKKCICVFLLFTLGFGNYVFADSQDEKSQLIVKMTVLQTSILALINFKKLNDTDDVINAIKIMKDSYQIGIQSISGYWGGAIKDDYQLDFTYLDKSFCSTDTEDRTVSLYSIYEFVMDEIKNSLKGLKRDDYPETFKLYAMLSQYKIMVYEPSGSYLSYSGGLTSLNNDFAMQIAYAELENKIYFSHNMSTDELFVINYY